MHPAYMWFKHAQEAHRAHHEAHCGEGGERGHGRHHGGHGGPFEGGPGPGWRGRMRDEAQSWHAGGFGEFGGGGGGLGVRRPLRFLAHKLDLRDDQVTELAAILNELKTERAQADVDDRRTIAGLADAVAAETFDDSKAKDAGEIRVKSAENLRQAVTKALGKIHALLDSEQRVRLAYLIRTGVLTL
ncbi:MAG: Spy/CpxP family protein refolding chaperone [Polyangiaceae bacterium]